MHIDTTVFCCLTALLILLSIVLSYCLFFICLSLNVLASWRQVVRFQTKHIGHFQSSQAGWKKQYDSVHII